MSVEYRDIEGYPGYQASSEGDIWSRHISGGKGGIGSTWRKLRPRPDKDGYLSVTLFRDSKRKTMKVSHLILQAFVGPRPDGMEACHYPDSDITNNRPENLAWLTHAENIQHKIEMGTIARGERHGMVKITEVEVMAIRRERRELGTSYKKLGAKHGINHSHVGSIINRRVWKHVEDN